MFYNFLFEQILLSHIVLLCNFLSSAAYMSYLRLFLEDELFRNLYDFQLKVTYIFNSLVLYYKQNDDLKYIY